MKKPKFCVVSFAFCILIFGLLDARPVGFAWLRIPVGAREAALAGCGTASAIGPQALVSNPAATATVAPFSLQVGYTKWFLDTHYQSLFVTRNFYHFTLGAGVVSFSNGPFEYRDDRPTEKPLGTFTPLDLTGYLNISKSLGPQAEIGITGRYFYSKISEYQASGIGGDLGVRYHPIENLTLGAAVVDFGRTLYYKYELFWLPTRSRLGLKYRLPIGANEFNFTIDGSYFVYSKELAAQLGSEFVLGDIVYLRAGYDIFNVANKLNFGLGVHRRLFRLDYAFSPLAFNLGTAHRFTLTFGY